jgi:hypothetical protein
MALQADDVPAIGERGPDHGIAEHPAPTGDKQSTSFRSSSVH